MTEKNITNYDNQKSSLADIILIISKHLSLILVLTLITTGINIFYVFKTYEPKYISTTKMFIPGEGGGVGEFTKLASQFGFGTQGAGQLGFDISSSSMYPDIVDSHTFAEIMLDKNFYTEKYGKLLPLIAIFTYGDNPVPGNIDTLRIASLNTVSSMVKFDMIMGFFIMEVTTPEPQLSRDLADTIIVELDKLQRKFKKQNVSETVIYLEQKISIAKIELEDIEDQLKSFREKNRNVDNSPTLWLIQERLQRDVEIQKGIFLTLKQQLELTKIDEVQKSSFVNILDHPSLPLIVSNPITKSKLFIGGFVGFFFAIFLAFMIEYFKNRNTTELSKLKSAKFYAINSIKRMLTLSLIRKK